MHHVVKLLIVCLLALAPGAALACRSPANADGLRDEVTALVNQARKAASLPPVQGNTALTKAAQAHACDNAASGMMSHEGSDGSTLTDRMARVGYAYREAAENVAAGYPDPTAVVAGWIGSQGHRRNILTPRAEHIGIGVALDANGTPYWTMNIGRD